MIPPQNPEGTPPPLVYIYDRTVTGNRQQLLARLQTCGAYAREQGWQVAGWFADHGEDALTEYRRPALDALLNCMDGVERGRERFVLVYHWNRLANGLMAQAVHLRRVRLVGGSLRSVREGDGDAPYTARGQLTALVSTL